MRRSLFAFAVGLLAAVSVAAQEMRPVSYVAEFQIKSGGTDWINLIKKYDKPMLDKLMADGTVLAWGLDVVVIHRGEGVTHRIWVVTRDYAGMDKVVAGFRSTGYGYRDHTGQQGYDISMADPSWFADLARNKPHVMQVLYAEKAWANHQDAYAFMRRPII